MQNPCQHLRFIRVPSIWSEVASLGSVRRYLMYTLLLSVCMYDCVQKATQCAHASPEGIQKSREDNQNKAK